MKRTKLTIIKLWKQLFMWKKLSNRLQQAVDDNKKQIIIDQLFFGLNTDESIALLKKVNIAFKDKMEARKIEAISIEHSISAYYAEA